MKSEEWIGVDLDGTLAHYESGQFNRMGPEYIGEPIPLMVQRVKEWLSAGIQVKIMTARAYPMGTMDEQLGTRGVDIANQAIRAINKWCFEHLGQVLPVTCVKDYDMIALYDDRAVGVECNTGQLIGYDFMYRPS